jgi:hypothetical protein
MPTRYATRRTAAPAFSIAQVVVLAVGVAAVVFGVLAMARAGLSTPLDTPMVNVFGFPHTALLGIFETIAGVLLLLSALGRTGGLVAIVVGIVLVIGGVLFLAELNWFMTHLSNDSSFGWVPIIGGGAVVVSLMVLP